MITQIDLVRRLLGRADTVDWEAVFTVELPRVFNYFRYHGLDDADAEDLTAATFEKAWRARTTYRSERAGAATWLMAIAQRTAADHFRSYRTDARIDAFENTPGQQGTGHNPEETALQREEIERLRLLLGDLPERERELVALKYGAELTNRAIAKITGLSESNVGTILHRVVTTLRAQMERDR